MSEKVRHKTAAIAASANLSEAVLVDGAAIVGIVMPATWTAANLTFQVSVDGTTYNNLYDQFGTEVNVPASTSRYIQTNPADFEGFVYIKVRSGTSGTPVTQAAQALLTLAVEEI